MNRIIFLINMLQNYNSLSFYSIPSYNTFSSLYYDISNIFSIPYSLISFSSSTKHKNTDFSDNLDFSPLFLAIFVIFLFHLFLSMIIHE